MRNSLPIRIGMSTTVTSPCAANYAESILRAWVTGDRFKLEEELDRGMRAQHPQDDGWEEERVELVNAIANQMKALFHGNPIDVDEVRIRLFVHLLRSLMDSAGKPSVRM